MATVDRNKAVRHPIAQLIWVVIVFSSLMFVGVVLSPWLTQHDTSLSRNELGFDRWPWTWITFTFLGLWIADMRILPVRYFGFRFKGQIRMLWRALYSTSIPIATFVACVLLGVDRPGYTVATLAMMLLTTFLVAGILAWSNKRAKV